MRDRRLLAAALWVLLAFLVWNVRFDLGVRVTASAYLRARATYVRGAGPRVEMASAMRAGARDSARAATMWALPAAAVGVALLATRLRRFRPISQR
jgi:hypothetical protein